MILIIPESKRDLLRKLDKKTRKLIGAELRKFQNDEPVDFKKLKTERDLYRIAAGEWRIMLLVQKEDNRRIFYVIGLMQRKDAYR